MTISIQDARAAAATALEMQGRAGIANIIRMGGMDDHPAVLAVLAGEMVPSSDDVVTGPKQSSEMASKDFGVVPNLADD